MWLCRGGCRGGGGVEGCRWRQRQVQCVPPKVQVSAARPKARWVAPARNAMNCGTYSNTSTTHNTVITTTTIIVRRASPIRRWLALSWRRSCHHARRREGCRWWTIGTRVHSLSSVSKSWIKTHRHTLSLPPSSPSFSGCLFVVDFLFTSFFGSFGSSFLSSSF